MSADYTGLHGRSPYEGPYQAWRGSEEEHAAPEHWEELDRGICPWCGRTVRWDEEREAWLLDPSLTVLVLTEKEYRLIDHGLRAYHASNTTAVAETMTRMYDLNRPYEGE